MPEPTPKLGIPKPLPPETVSLAAFHEIYDTIDANAASQAEVDQKFDAANGHRHTGQDGDAPPIPLAGIDPQARTSEGGTEPIRLAVTNSAGRVGDSEKLGGAPASTYLKRGAANTDVEFVTAVLHRVDTREVVITYDAQGRPATIEEKDGANVVKTVTITYGPDGRPSQIQETAGGVTVTSTPSYDASGKLASVAKAVG